MPQEVIDMIHHIATVQRKIEGLEFTRYDGTAFHHEDDDESIQENAMIDDDLPDTAKYAEIAGVDDDDPNEFDATDDKIQDMPPAQIEEQEFLMMMATP